MANKNLNKAKIVKDDEFYTLMPDIENELNNYKHYFKDKIIFLNCDDYRKSNFWKYFKDNFQELKFKKVISMGLDAPAGMLLNSNGLLLEGEWTLKEDGDFRSDESIDILKKSDIVITNPPFSIFREYIAQIVEHDKKFLIIGNKNAVNCADIFPLIKNNKTWLGINTPNDFELPDGTITTKVRGLCRWFTNLEHNKRNEMLMLTKSIKDSDVEYSKYDNYDAINVDKTKNIPKDYFEEMGVPVTFIDKYNPNQFEIIGIMARNKIDQYNKGYPTIYNKRKYSRIIIRRRTNAKEDSTCIKVCGI